MKYEIENPVKIEGKLLTTVISNGSKERVTVSKATLKQIKKKQPELHKLVSPYFEEKKNNPTKKKDTKKDEKPIVSIEDLQQAIDNIKNASMTLEKDGKSWKVRASRNLYYLHYSKKFRFLIGWNSIKQSSMHIENKKQFDTIVEEIKEYASKVK